MTATGREAGRALFGDRVVQAWLPYDVPFAVRAFPARISAPRAGLLMETELWPNLMRACAHARRSDVPRQRAPVGAIGARATRAFPSLDAADARVARRRRRAERMRTRARLAALGARRRRSSPAISSSTSTCRTQALALGPRAARALRRARPVLARGVDARRRGSAAPRRARAQPLPPRRSTVIVPRHPQRFDDGRGSAARSAAIPFVRRSDNAPVPADVARRARRLDGRNARATTRRPTSRSSAAACFRSAGRT